MMNNEYIKGFLKGEIFQLKNIRKQLTNNVDPEVILLLIDSELDRLNEGLKNEE